MITMQTFRNVCVGAAVSAIGFAGAASANSFHYDYTGTMPYGPDPAPSLTCSVFGFSNTSCTVEVTGSGIGIDGPGDIFNDDYPTEIDGSPVFSGEVLKIDFGFDRVWDEITFGNWDNNDDVSLTWNGDSTFYPGNNGTVSLGGVQSSFLYVEAFGQGFCVDNPSFLCLSPFGNDQFTVAEVKVSSVPLPAAGWMLLAGLGGLAAMRRRNKEA